MEADRRLYFCVVALAKTQECFGGVVRGKPHEGGALMSVIDRILEMDWAKEMLIAGDAVERLSGMYPTGAMTQLYDQIRLQAREELRSPLEECAHALLRIQALGQRHVTIDWIKVQPGVEAALNKLAAERIF